MRRVVKTFQQHGHIKKWAAARRRLAIEQLQDTAERIDGMLITCRHRFLHLQCKFTKNQVRMYFFPKNNDFVISRNFGVIEAYVSSNLHVLDAGITADAYLQTRKQHGKQQRLVAPAYPGNPFKALPRDLYRNGLWRW